MPNPYSIDIKPLSLTESAQLSYLEDKYLKQAKRGSKKRSFIRRMFSKKTWSLNKMSCWIRSVFGNLLSCTATNIKSDQSNSENIDDFDCFHPSFPIDKSSSTNLFKEEGVLISIVSEEDEMIILLEEIIHNAVMTAEFDGKNFEDKLLIPAYIT